jgi:hypothetical protein
MSTSRLVPTLLALSLVVGLGLAAVWLVRGLPASSAPANSLPPSTAPPDAEVNIVLHGPTVTVVSDAGPVMHVGARRIQLLAPPVDGIRLDGDGLFIRAAQLARYDGQMVTISETGFVWRYGPLNSRHVVQDESGQWVLHIEQNLPVTLRLSEDALRSARATVTDRQALALLDEAIAGFAAAGDPAAWRDPLRLRPQSGAEVIAALGRAQGSLQLLIGDRTRPSALRDSLGVEGRTAVYDAAITAVFVGHSLARAAYEEAEAARVPPEVLRRARAAEGAGIRARDGGAWEAAIQHYLDEWEIAVQALPPATPPATPSP